jgi:hypothetical protein
VLGGLALRVAFEPLFGPGAGLNELRRSESAPRSGGALFGPEVCDLARKTSRFSRLGGIHARRELMPKLGAAINRRVELGPDFIDSSHADLNAPARAPIPRNLKPEAGLEPTAYGLQIRCSTS